MVAIRRYARRGGAYAALGIAIAAVLSLTWLYILPEQPNITGQQASQGPENGYYPGGAGCKPWKLAALPAGKGLKEADRCAEAYEKHRIDQQNLNEQGRLVSATERNVWLVSAQVQEGRIQALATVAAFIAAAIAAWGAYRAYRAAEATLEHAQAVSDAELRPYVFVEKTSWEYLHDRDNVDLIMSWRLCVTIRNTGKTPAKRIISNFNMRPSPDIIDDAFDFTYSNANRSIGSLGPNQPITSNTEIPMAVVNDAWTRTTRHYVWGFFEYDGVKMGERFRTECCFQIFTNDNPSSKDARIFAVLTEVHNGADESAKYQPQT